MAVLTVNLGKRQVKFSLHYLGYLFDKSGLRADPKKKLIDFNLSKAKDCYTNETFYGCE